MKMASPQHKYNRDFCCVRGKWCSKRHWSGHLRSCIPCCPPCNQEEPLNNVDNHQAHLPPLTLDDLDKLLAFIKAQVKNLVRASSSPDDNQLLMNNVLSQGGEHEEVVSSFMNSIPIDLTKKVVGGSKDVLMPLLTQALKGLDIMQWVGMGFRLIAWSLYSWQATTKNNKDCLEILQEVVGLMEETKKIWVHANRSHDDTSNRDLEKSIEIAFHCAIICTTNVTDPSIVRYIDAKRFKGVIDELKSDIKSAYFNNLKYMVKDKYCDAPKQMSFKDEPSDERVVGVDEAAHEAMQHLTKDCNDMVAVCLHGIGGIGKSFIAMDIFKKFQQRKSFHRDCRVELELGVREEKLVDIQKQILQKLCGVADVSNINDCVEGKEKLRKELEKIKQGPIFLYLDNISEHQHLEKILPKASCFPKGSRLLVTSRGVNIREGIIRLGIRDCELIEVKKLHDKEAKELLWIHINNISTTEKEEISSFGGPFKELEEKVVKLCGGLPLALKVVGGYIGSYENGPRNARVWQGVVKAMEEAEPFGGEAHDELYSRINFSIQSLDDNVRSAFLDIV